MEDSRIIDLFWQRNEAALEETDRKYRGYCFAIAHNILASPEDSEECVSDTWLRAWGAMPPQRPNSLRLFVAKITHNLSLSRLRARAADKRGAGESALVLDELAECVAGASDVAGEYEAKALAACVSRFVRALPAREGNVFIRRYFFTEPVADIARRYGLRENNVMVSLHRTRKKLRRYLQKEGWLDG